MPTLGRLWFASLLFGLAACTGANPVQPGASGPAARGSPDGAAGSAPGVTTTDRGERSFGAEPIGGVVVETTPRVGAPGGTRAAPGSRGALKPAPAAATSTPQATSDAAPARVVR